MAGVGSGRGASGGVGATRSGVTMSSGRRPRVAHAMVCGVGGAHSARAVGRNGLGGARRRPQTAATQKVVARCCGLPTIRREKEESVGVRAGRVQCISASLSSAWSHGDTVGPSRGNTPWLPLPMFTTPSRLANPSAPSFMCRLNREDANSSSLSTST